MQCTNQTLMLPYTPEQSGLKAIGNYTLGDDQAIPGNTAHAPHCRDPAHEIHEESGQTCPLVC